MARGLLFVRAALPRVLSARRRWTNMDLTTRAVVRAACCMEPLLEVRELCADYTDTLGQLRPALTNVYLNLRVGEVVGVLGESGSGKSTLAQAIPGILPPAGRVRRGQVLFEGRDLLSLKDDELERLRGSRLSLIFQEPSIALHPTMRAGEQVAEVVGAHGTFPRRVRREKALRALAEVFPADAERIYSSVPHQLSGGQRQRVLIAQAIACRPALLIADEPTASLDTTTQAEILVLFRELRQRHNLAILFITHSPALLAGFADRVVVLYGGCVVEEGPAESVLRSPQHPYVRGLLASLVPAPEGGPLAPTARLPVIRPAAADAPACGCVFEPRCDVALPACRKRVPPPVPTAERHTVCCLLYES